MNVQRLKAFERQFLNRYPDGFFSPEIEAIAKKHKIEKMVELAQSAFSESAFADAEQIAAHFVKLVSQSSVVSLFEKPKLRDAVQSMTFQERAELASSLYALLYGDERAGFEGLVNALHAKRIAKWPVITSLLVYFRPEREVIIKPTTVKAVIKLFEIEGLQYASLPNYEFYQAYRTVINDMKALVDASLSPTNAAFSGFLMMAVEAYQREELQ